LIAAFLTVLTFNANAAVCGEWQNMRNKLSQYQEAPIIRATGQGGGLLEIWRSPNGKTWSITVTVVRNGIKTLCLLMSGDNMEPIKRVEGKAA